MFSTLMSDRLYPTPKHSVEIVTRPGINTTRSIVGRQVLKHTSYKAWKGRKKENLKKNRSYHNERFAKFPVAQDMLIWDLYANRVV